MSSERIWNLIYWCDKWLFFLENIGVYRLVYEVVIEVGLDDVEKVRR